MIDKRVVIVELCNSLLKKKEEKMEQIVGDVAKSNKVARGEDDGIGSDDDDDDNEEKEETLKGKEKTRH